MRVKYQMIISILKGEAIVIESVDDKAVKVHIGKKLTIESVKNYIFSTLCSLR